MNEQQRDDLRGELAQILNRYSAENGSNTPDFVLAAYLSACLIAFDFAVTARDQWYLGDGRIHAPGGGSEVRPNLLEQ